MAKRTKALLVGINDYAPQGPGGQDLRGCVNDVKDMANTLVISGFDPKSFRILTDRKATKKAILDNLKWLLQDSKKDDCLVFYYSGHGSYRVDLNNDEPDGKDELICPHDWPENITDDDFKKVFDGLKDGVRLEVFFDCCHSGTGTRNLMINNDAPVLTPRFIAPPFDDTVYEDFKVDYKRSTKKILSFDKSSKSSKKEIAIVENLNHILWAGCRDNQLSNETTIEGHIRGIFTYHLCKVLKATSGKITRKKLDSLISAAIRRQGFEDQVPQLESSSKHLENQIFC